MRKVGEYVVWNLRPEPVGVPLAEDMEDEIFIKHLEHRHGKDCGFEKPEVARRAIDAWLPSYRAFHDRLHTLETPGQYDHVHEEDE